MDSANDKTKQPAKRPREIVPEIERLKRTTLIEYATSNNRNSVDLFKWTLASLLVANGGALLALLGSDLRKTAFEQAGWYFAGGLLLALLGGFFFTIAFTLVGNDYLRRAWDVAVITPKDFEQPKLEPTTLRWSAAAALSWLLCFGAFAFGCINMAYVPTHAAWDEAGQRSLEASYRSALAAQAFVDLSNDPRATRPELRAAEDRARLALIEADIANDRIARLLDPEDQGLRQKIREAKLRLDVETARAKSAPE